jgi:DNA-binding beta-propeller fold protein YncE
MMRPNQSPHRRNNRRDRLLLWLGLCVLTAGAMAATIRTAPLRHVFDLTGDPLGKFALPTDVAVSPQGRIFVVDGGHHRVVAFDAAGKSLFSHGAFYVADKGNHRIQVFSHDGAWQAAIPVAVQGKPAAPVDVAIDAQQRLYITTTQHRVVVLDSRGRLIRQWGGEGESKGEFRFAATVALDRAGLVHVVDALNARVQVFEPAGRYIISVGEWGVLPGQLFRPKGVATDARGRVYVSDSYLDVVQVFDENRHFLHVLGEGGKPHRFTAAGGIAIDQHNRLYVAEVLKHRVTVFELAP